MGGFLYPAYSTHPVYLPRHFFDYAIVISEEEILAFWLRGPTLRTCYNILYKAIDKKTRNSELNFAGR